MEKHCKYCETLFFAKRKDSLYCSPSCRQMAYIERSFNTNSGTEMSIDTSQRVNSLTETPTDLKKTGNYVSIDISQSVNNEAITSIYPSSESPENVNPSIDTSVKTVNNNSSKTSIDGLSGSEFDVLTSSKDRKQKEDTEYKEVMSSFIDCLGDLHHSRKHEEVLFQLIWNNCSASKWVSLRFKCLIQRLLTVSEMKCVPISILKELCNAFTMMIQSSYFKYLPELYPYTETIEELREGLREICLSAEEDETIRFRFRSENKKIMIVILVELIRCGVPKNSFNDLFEDKQ